mmetsp:Transcript_30429/g.84851  ORF Transcript_30429/g.84851 Transcript_30429/m.84851 type:complete len:260 (-) Transcript_30429:27-806(-)
MHMSAPAAQASRASARLRHSTSILELNPAASRARRTAPVMLPALQMWLSFSMIMCDRSMRCVLTPPTTSAYFSTMRKPGVVLRVPATSPCHLAAALRSASSRAAVAMPLARVTMLSAVRSASRILRTGPITLATTVTGFTSAPSGRSHSTSSPMALKTASAKGTPARMPRDFPSRFAVSTVSPTTRPPTSNEGVSSLNQSSTTLRAAGGRMQLGRPAKGRAEPAPPHAVPARETPPIGAELDTDKDSDLLVIDPAASSA